jgi:hypothetical protein
LHLRILALRFFRILSQTSRNITENILSLPYDCKVLFALKNNSEIIDTEPLSFVQCISRFVLIPFYFFSSYFSVCSISSVFKSYPSIPLQLMLESFSLLSSIASYGFFDHFKDIRKPKSYLEKVNTFKKNLNYKEKGEIILEKEKFRNLKMGNVLHPNQPTILLSSLDDVASFEEMSSLCYNVERLQINFLFFLIFCFYFLIFIL